MPLSAKCRESLTQAVAFAGAGLIGLATQLPVRDFVDAAFDGPSHWWTPLIRSDERERCLDAQNEAGVRSRV